MRALPPCERPTHTYADATVLGSHEQVESGGQVSNRNRDTARRRMRRMPRAVSGVAALLIACNDNAKPPLAPDRDLPVMSIGESELYAYRAAELEHMFDDASHATHVEPVPRTRVITRLARVHARIEGTCGLCVRALPIVEHAIADAVLAGKDDACDAALDFLRVLTRDSGDSQTADSFAQRLIDRFGVRPESAECVTAIRALYAELET